MSIQPIAHRILPAAPLPSEEEKSSPPTYESETSEYSTSPDPFQQWRPAQKSRFLIDDDSIYSSAKKLLDQGFYKDALERLSAHSNPSKVLPEFLEAVVGDYVSHNVCLEPFKELEKEQVDGAIGAITSEAPSSLLQIVLEIGQLISTEPTDEQMKRIDRNLASFFEEIEVNNYNFRATVICEAAKLLSRREYYFEATWLLFVMNPFHEDDPPYWHRLFNLKRDEAAVEVVANLAKAGALAPAVKLANYIKNETLRGRALTFAAQKLEREGYRCAARFVADLGKIL